MKIAKVIDGKIVNIVDCYDVYSKTTATDEQLSQKSYVRVNMFRPHDYLTEKLVQCQPVFEDNWVYIVEVQKMTDEQIQECKDVALTEIRTHRNKLLQETDGTQAVDNPSPKKAEWAAYRQLLRDLPARIMSEGLDPRTFGDWPTQP